MRRLALLGAVYTYFMQLVTKGKILRVLWNLSHGTHHSLAANLLPPVTLLGREDYSPKFFLTMVFPLTGLCSGCTCGDRSEEWGRYRTRLVILFIVAKMVGWTSIEQQALVWETELTQHRFWGKMLWCKYWTERENQRGGFFLSKLFNHLGRVLAF